jgi:hypothetical protein
MAWLTPPAIQPCADLRACGRGLPVDTTARVDEQMCRTRPARSRWPFPAHPSPPQSGRQRTRQPDKDRCRATAACWHQHRITARNMCVPSRPAIYTLALNYGKPNLFDARHRLALYSARRCHRGRHSRGTELHRSAHKKTRVAASPRALRPAWRMPHLPIMRRVSAVAPPAGVFITARTGEPARANRGRSSWRHP